MNQPAPVPSILALSPAAPPSGSATILPLPPASGEGRFAGPSRGAPGAEQLDGGHPSPPSLTDFKHLWRIEEVVQALGVSLTRSGEDRLAGHCPFHEDRTPSFMVYRSSQRFRCYGRCGRRGDVLDFVQGLRNCSLTMALQWLEATWPEGTRGPLRTSGRDQDPASRMVPSVPAEGLARGQRHHPPIPGAHVRRVADSAGSHPDGTSDADNACQADADEADRQLVLTLATALYAQAFTCHQEVIVYLRRRGIALQTAERCRLGYVEGHTLARYLAGEPVLRAAAERCGLLTQWGRECFAGRLVVPEVRAGRTVWLIGRTVPPVETPDAPQEGPAAGAHTTRGALLSAGGVGRSGGRSRREPPRYLGLATPRHYLLGYGAACAALAKRARATTPGADGWPLVPGILVVEGALDYVIAQGWRLPVPCVALLGTHASPGQVTELADLQRQSGGAPLLLALDGDEAGRVATQDVAHAVAAAGLAHEIMPPLPEAKDLGELGTRPEGRATLLRALDTLVRSAGRHGTPHTEAGSGTTGGAAG